MSILDAMMVTSWAILDTELEKLDAIAARENHVTPEALEAYRAKTAERAERMRVRDGVAIIDITGPLFKKANLFVQISGATSYEIARRDLQVALDDPAVSAIMLKIDSPGGEANGCDELATAIYEARGKKPITSYVSGMACSGGYWIASAADNIVVSDLAVLGSIGVVLGITDRKKADEKNGVSRIDFVSSQSPGKRPDHGTDEGKARIQKMVDDLAEVFVSAVAKHRGVTPETVIEKFGAGGVEIGAKAVALGMADKVGQFEATFMSLVKGGSTRRNSNRSIGDFLMTDKSNPAATEENTVDVAAIERNAKQTAQARIKGILTSEEGKSMPTLASHYAYDTDVSVDDAVAAMKAAKADLDAMKPSASEDKQQSADASQGYKDRKTEAGALGLGTPAATGQEGKVDAMAGWKKAAEAANARFNVGGNA